MGYLRSEDQWPHRFHPSCHHCYSPLPRTIYQQDLFHQLSPNGASAQSLGQDLSKVLHLWATLYFVLHHIFYRAIHGWRYSNFHSFLWHFISRFFIILYSTGTLSDTKHLCIQPVLSSKYCFPWVKNTNRFPLPESAQTNNLCIIRDQGIIIFANNRNQTLIYLSTSFRVASQILSSTPNHLS